LATDAGNVNPLRLLLSISLKPSSDADVITLLDDSPGLAVFLGILDDKQLVLLQRL
jgi:hypothetical protein